MFFTLHVSKGFKRSQDGVQGLDLKNVSSCHSPRPWLLKDKKGRDVFLLISSEYFLNFHCVYGFNMCSDIKS